MTKSYTRNGFGTPRNIARAEVLDVIESHIEMCEFTPRFGPESKEFTAMKRNFLRTIHNELADQWGFERIKEAREYLATTEN